jgi:CheY-like chemotaxis protein/tetratricopeptide (TPR) repeat protein
MTNRVLLVDESLIMQKVVKLALDEEGIELATAKDAGTAVMIMKYVIPDLLMVDASMPGGFALCGYIKDDPRLSHIPVVVVAGAADPMSQTEARAARADAQITKPPESRALIQTIRTLLKARAATEPPLSHPDSMDTIEPEAEQIAFEFRDLPYPDGAVAEPPIAVAEPPIIEASPSGEPAAAQAYFDRFAPPPIESHEDAPEPSYQPAAPAPEAAVNIETPQSRDKDTRLVRAALAALILLSISVGLWQASRSRQMPQVGQSNRPAEVASQEASVAPLQQPPADSTEKAGDRASLGSVFEPLKTEPVSGQPPESDERKEDSLEANHIAKHKGVLADRADSDRSGLISAAPTLANSEGVRRLRNRMLERARKLEDRGLLDEAEQEYRAASATFPSDQQISLAHQRVVQKQTARQREDLSRANQTARRTGLDSFRRGDYESARARLSVAVEAGLGDTAVLYALGMSQLRLGRTNEARPSLERCLAANPGYAPALVGLAQVHAAAGRRQQAITLLNQALELGGGAEFTPYRIRKMLSELDSRYKP